ncbi:MAG: flavodoxin family protein [Fusobacteriaceae bacterium]
MKVVAINGSPKKNGNTAAIFSEMEKVFVKEGIELEVLHVGGENIHGCIGCGGCAKVQNETCIINGEVNSYIKKMAEADGIIIGSPVYYAGVAGTMKSFLDRSFYVAGSNGGLFKHKVGAAVVADRRAGGVVVFNELNNYLTYSQMFLATGNYWNVVFGRTPGEANQDIEGMQTVRILAENMAWLLKSVELGKKSFPIPEGEKKTWFHFVR